jgi:tRNA A37 threonylcarbamoyladenosine modification protein TsaB
MIVSLFLSSTKYSLAVDDLTYTIEILAPRNTSSEVIQSLADLFAKRNVKNVKEIIYSSGPGSFTSLRVAASIASGLSLVFKNAKMFAMPTFLPYAYILHKKDITGTIAIDSRIGTYHIIDYKGRTLKNYTIINKTTALEQENIFFEDDSVFAEVDFSIIQIELLNSDFYTANNKFVKQGLQLSYGSTPKYKVQEAIS